MAPDVRLPRGSTYKLKFCGIRGKASGVPETNIREGVPCHKETGDIKLGK